MRRLQTWPRLLLTLPFPVRLALVVVIAALALAFYIISFNTLRNGNVLVIPCGLSAWIFKKRGLLLYLGIGFLVAATYQTMRFHTLLWQLAFALSFFGGFLLLCTIGYIVVILRSLLDSADEARLKAQQAEQQIAAAYEQQRQLNNLKNQFILNVNHELRSPLTVISGYLSLLLEKYDRFDKTAQVGFLKNALRSCNELQTLANDVLETMVVGGQKEELRIEDIPVSDIVRETVASFEQMWDRQLQTQIDISDEAVVRGNLQGLRHVLRNLLSNAYKYTSPDTCVVISATIPLQALLPDSPAQSSPREVCIIVKDEGPGIPSDQIPLLFGQFVRLPRDLVGSVRGSGLGLYISKNLVEAMGGRIWVESSGIAGEGSRFCFTLPYATSWQRT